MLRAVVLATVAIAGCAPGPTPSGGDLTVIEHVTAIPMDRPGVLADHSVVVRDGRIVEVAPSDRITPPASAQRIDGRGKFLVPGLADMHAHAIEDSDLELYAAAGVTQLRVLAANPVALRLRDEPVTGQVLRPSLFVEGFLTDGDPPVYPFARVTEDTGVAAEIALARKLRLPSIKVYNNLTRPAYDAIVAQARAAGLRVVGHVPGQVGLDHVLESKQRSIEHLSGYARWLVAAGGRTPSGSDSRLMFADVDERHMTEIARRTIEAGTWNCPTLVLAELVSVGDDAGRLSQVAGMQYLPTSLANAWLAAATPVTPERDELMRQATIKRRALVRALHQQGARLLVGTDTGNPAVVPGFAVLDEIAALAGAGLPPWDALRAATSGAAEFLGQSETFGTIAVGRRADLLLVAANPLDDVANLRRREGVMLRGVWHPVSALDARLAALAQRIARNPSPFEGVPEPAPEGTREFAGRYEFSVRGRAIGEQRLFVDRQTGGGRVAAAEVALGDTVGVLHVRVDLNDAARAFRQQYLGATLREMAGSLEMRLESGRLRATVRTPFGDTVERTFDAPAGVLFDGTALSLPPLVPFFERLARLDVRQRIDMPFVEVTGGVAPHTASSRIRAVREPDVTRVLDGRDVTARVFATELVIDQDKVPGTIVLDAAGHLIELRVGNQRLLRVP